MIFRQFHTAIALLLVAVLPAASPPSADSTGLPSGASVYSGSSSETGNSQQPSGFVWPTGRAVTVVRGFDPPAQPWQAGHRGVDLQLAPGSPVYAAGDGTVIYAGQIAGRGVVSIEHANGLRTTYEPLEATATRGHIVKAGEQIGTLVPGHAADTLHWGAKFPDDTYINPLSLLGYPRFRLWS